MGNTIVQIGLSHLIPLDFEIDKQLGLFLNQQLQVRAQVLFFIVPL